MVCRQIRKSANDTKSCFVSVCIKGSKATKVCPATTMEMNAEIRGFWIDRIYAIAIVYGRLKFNFPYDTMVQFEHTTAIFGRHGCIMIWRGADWDGTSTNTLRNLYMDLRNSVNFVLNTEIPCANPDPRLYYV